MAWKSNKWGAFPKDLGFSGSNGMKQVTFMARGGKVSKGSVKGTPAPVGESPGAKPGLKNTDVPKFQVTTIADKSKDAAMAGKSFVGSPSHGKGAKTPGGTRMPKAKGGAVRGGGETRGALAADVPKAPMAGPRKRGGSLPALSMKPRFS